jgi:hypothetical protein
MWLTKLRQYALAEARAGRDIPGYGLRDKNPTPKLAASDAAVARHLHGLGLEDKCYSLKTAVQLKKIMGEDQFDEMVVAGLI